MRWLLLSHLFVFCISLFVASHITCAQALCGTAAAIVPYTYQYRGPNEVTMRDDGSVTDASNVEFGFCRREEKRKKYDFLFTSTSQKATRSFSGYLD